MIRFAICDDKPEDRAMLRHYVEAYFARHNEECAVQEYADGCVLRDDMQDGVDFDAVLLDIFMEHSFGIQIAHALREFNAQLPIVFTTYSRDYALESYSVQAFSYLLKPIEPDQMLDLLNRLMAQLNQNRKKSLLLKLSGGQQRIPYDDISYIESKNTSIFVHTLSGDCYRIYAKLGDVEAELSGKSFLRCHQSFIVNLEHVRKVQREFTLTCGEVIPIRRQSLKEVREKYYDYVIRTTL